MIRALVLRKSQTTPQFEIPEKELTHLRKALRIRTGETLELLDGSGFHAVAKWDGQNAQITTNWANDLSRLSKPVHIYIGYLKGDSLEWVIEKATELGARSLTPLLSDHCVVQPKKESSELLSRFNRIAESALKQSGRTDKLTIYPPIEFNQAASKAGLGKNQWFFDEKVPVNPDGSPSFSNAEIERNEEHSLWIGPEGGWSDRERQIVQKIKFFQFHSLSPWVLRAETACLAALSVFRFKL